MSERSREFEFWTPEPIWSGERAFVLASGPSLTPAIADKLRGEHVIAVNSSGRLAPWAEVLFFTDSSWYEQRREMVADWPGRVISMSRIAKRELPDKVCRVKGIHMPGFPGPGFEDIRQGRSSGQTGLSLAVALGATAIALVGFDMRVVDGREHHHDEYAGTPRDLGIYAREFAPAFQGWNGDALRVGVTIVNCTPGSAITEFPFADIDEMLACAAQQ